ncbi:MAG: FAD-dependent oxidoreductase [Candidatus Latescibacteria bacterium]|nr:FAD-dependent oxidoreductase [Candidatus Latescibacterota bacterium]
MYDVIVIGGGPAGMTACVYLARKKMSVLLISNDFGGQVLWTSEIENYMGYQYIMGRELAQKFTEQVNSFPIAVRVPDEVIAVEQDEHLFLVQTKYEGNYKGQAVIIASGKQPRILDIPKERELTGRGVSYCATCDAPLYAGKDAAIIGGANSAIWAAIDLKKVARKVYLIVRSKIKADHILVERIDQEANVEQLIGYIPIEIKGKDRVESLVIKNTKTDEIKELSVQGIFVEAGLIPNTGFLRDMVKTNERNEIIVACNCETSEGGVFACGDVTNVSDKQIIIACGEGAKAALSAYRYIIEKK